MKKLQIVQVMAEIKSENPLGGDPEEITEYQDRFFGQSYKDKREWLILGSAASCMKNNGWPYPEFAKKQIPPDPDFLATFNDGNDISIEITECLPNGYKRHDYYRGRKNSQFAQLQSVPFESPESGLAILQNAINKKSAMPYAKESSLVVYFNVRTIKHRGPDLDVIDALEREDLHIDIPTFSFRNIFILSCCMKRVIVAG